MSLQAKRPLNSGHGQSSNSSSHSPPLRRATLSLLLHVSPSPNSPSIKLMDSLSQDKMEAQPHRHDNTLALRQQQPNEDRFLFPNDELNSIGQPGQPLSLLATLRSIMTQS
jgi:hypothetical protein